MNNTTQSQPDFSEFYINEKIRMTLMFLSVVAGLFGNALVAFVILTKKTRRKNDDIFLLNLACADFLNIAFDIIRFVVHLSYLEVNNQRRDKTLMYCKIFWAILTVPFCAGIFTITAMSLHRCWVILNPFKPKIRLQWINLCVLSTWVISIILFLPITISAVNNGSSCILQGWSAEDKRAYSFATTIVQYPLPLVVITIAYLNIGVYLRRPRVPQQSIVAKGGTLRRPQDETRKDSIAMTKTVGSIVLLFAILLLPLQISKMAHYYEVYKIWVYALWDYGDVFASMHSAINPYLYTIRTPYYRKQISSLFHRGPSTTKSKMSNANSTQGSRERFQSLSPSCATTEIELTGINASQIAEEEKEKEKEKEKELTSNANGYDIKL